MNLYVYEYAIELCLQDTYSIYSDIYSYEHIGI